MVIINPMKCENCNAELQPHRILVGMNNNGLTRVCAYCGHEVQVNKLNNGKE